MTHASFLTDCKYTSNSIKATGPFRISPVTQSSPTKWNVIHMSVLFINLCSLPRYQHLVDVIKGLNSSGVINLRSFTGVEARPPSGVLSSSCDLHRPPWLNFNLKVRNDHIKPNNLSSLSSQVRCYEGKQCQTFKSKF